VKTRAFGMTPKKVKRKTFQTAPLPNLYEHLHLGYMSVTPSEPSQRIVFSVPGFAVRDGVKLQSCASPDRNDTLRQL
jgi:hypothetical protein